MARLRTFGLVLVIGLVTSRAVADPIEVEVVDNPYSATIIYMTPTRQFGTAHFNLGAEKDRQNPHKISLYIVFAAMYDEDRWRDFYAASMRGGIELPFLAGDRQTRDCQSDGRCFRMEQAVMAISVTELREASQNGFDIMVFGKRGNEAFVKINPADAVALMKALGIE